MILNNISGISCGALRNRTRQRGLQRDLSLSCDCVGDALAGQSGKSRKIGFWRFRRGAKYSAPNGAPSNLRWQHDQSRLRVAAHAP
jgi:hypothetical protein